MNVHSARIWTMLVSALVVVPVLLFGRHPAEDRPGAADAESTAGALTLRKNPPLEFKPASPGNLGLAYLPATANAEVTRLPPHDQRRPAKGEAAEAVPPPRDLRLTSHLEAADRETRPPTSVESSQVRRHRVVDGETLQSIALEHLGDASRWEDLFFANRQQLERADLLPLGLELLIPASGTCPANPGVDFDACEVAGRTMSQTGHPPAGRIPSQPGILDSPDGHLESRDHSDWDGREGGLKTRWVPVPAADSGLAAPRAQARS